MSGPSVIAVLGAVFTLLGLLLLVLGRKEERDYYDAVARRPDAREFMTRFPVRPEPGSLKTGGYISLILGGALLVMALVFYLVG